MFHYWLHREIAISTTHLYLQASNTGIKECLQFADENATVDFRSVGGFDKNDSWMEHNIIENNPERNGNPSWALQIYDMKSKPALILEKLNTVPFRVHHFGFECSDGLWVTGESRTGQPYIKIDIPLKEETLWLEKIGRHFPFVKVIRDWNQPQDNYYVADEQGIKAIFPGVDTLFDFQEKEIFTITESFNQNL